MRNLANILLGRSVQFMTLAHGLLISNRRATQLARHLAEVIPPNKKILDIGSGNGRLIKHVIELRPDLTIQGIDIKCDRESPVPIATYDGVKIPFATDSWEICMASDVLHHCEDPIAILCEMKRVAKEAILLKDHTADGHFSRALLCAMDWVGNIGYGTKVPFNFLSSKEWQETFIELGLYTVHSRKKLRLYSYPLTWIFDGNLHFIALLAVKK